MGGRGMVKNAVVDTPIPPIEQEVQPRPCPRPKHWMLAPLLNKADAVTGSRDDDGP